jgi:hypothetical protein
MNGVSQSRTVGHRRKRCAEIRVSVSASATGHVDFQSRRLRPVVALTARRGIRVAFKFTNRSSPARRQGLARRPHGSPSMPASIARIHWRHGCRTCSVAPRSQPPKPHSQRGKGAGLYGGGADRVTFIRRLRALRPKATWCIGGAGRSEVRRDRRLEDSRDFPQISSHCLTSFAQALKRTQPELVHVASVWRDVIADCCWRNDES